MSTIIVAAPSGATRHRLQEFFAARAEVISLDRESLLSQGLLLIHDQGLRLGDRELVDGVDAAIITDSGYMWPLPALEPSRDQWEAARQDFDNLLRDDRETESLWYSTLAILEDRLPLVVNSSAAFASQAMKPFALMLLSERGVPVAPFVATNDVEEVERFADERPGRLRLLPLLPDEPARWLDDAGNLDELRLRDEPRVFQAIRGRDARRFIVVGDEAIDVDVAQNSSEELAQRAVEACQVLDLRLGDLLFFPDGEDFVLADFSPSPNLGKLSQEVSIPVLESLWELIQNAPGGER